MQKRTRLKRGTALAAAVVVMALSWPAARTSASSGGYEQTYTFDADFAAGAVLNVNYSAVANQLQLDIESSTFPIMWIANAGEDTVSKIDTTLNKEVGRYRTWFNFGYHGAWDGTAPSRTAVDRDGNAYVLNRHFNSRPASVMKVLATGYVDRNKNGVMDTVVDTNNNGIYDQVEALPIVDINGNQRPDSDSDGDNIADDGEIKDERIAWIRQVGAVNGLGRSICFDPEGDLWIGLYNSQAYYQLDSDGNHKSGPIATGVTGPYGCAIDANGKLWGANINQYITEIDTTANGGNGQWIANRFHGGASNYGITVGNNRVYVADWGGGSAYRIYNPVASVFQPGPGAGNGGSISVAVDGAGNVLSGAQYGATRKYTSGNSYLWQTLDSSGESRGTIVDSNGDIWRVRLSGSRVEKYSGSTGAWLASVPVGSLPYTYSDATGLTNLSETQKSGTWTVVQDSGAAGTLWDTVTWNALVPAGASVTGRVRAADVEGTLPSLPWVTVTSGNAMPSVVGRYIEVEIALGANPDDESPAVHDVHVLGHPPNTAPVPNAGEDVIVSCNADCQGEITLDASASTDADNDTLTYTWSNAPLNLSITTTDAQTTVFVPRGSWTFTLSASDGVASATDEVTVTAIDTTAPALSVPGSVTVSQGAACGLTPVSLGPATAIDACGPATVSSNAPAAFALGTTAVTFTATDESGNTTTGTTSVTVNDTTAPAIASVTPSTATLWPPNHQMVPVTFTWSVTDCDPGTACSVVSVSSNEPVNGRGDGNTAPDWEIVNGNTVRLRAERQGPATGRIYTVTVRCVDAAGNASTRAATVTVPHDQRPGRR